MTKFDELDGLLGDNEDARVLLGGIEILYRELKGENLDLGLQVSRLQRDLSTAHDELDEANEKAEETEAVMNLMNAFADANNWTDGRWTPIDVKYQLWDADQLAYRALNGITAEAR